MLSDVTENKVDNNEQKIVPVSLKSLHENSIGYSNVAYHAYEATRECEERGLEVQSGFVSVELLSNVFLSIPNIFEPISSTVANAVRRDITKKVECIRRALNREGVQTVREVLEAERSTKEHIEKKEHADHALLWLYRIVYFGYLTAKSYTETNNDFRTAIKESYSTTLKLYYSSVVNAVILRLINVLFDAKAYICKMYGVSEMSEEVENKFRSSLEALKIAAGPHIEMFATFYPSSKKAGKHESRRTKVRK